MPLRPFWSGHYSGRLGTQDIALLDLRGRSMRPRSLNIGQMFASLEGSNVHPFPLARHRGWTDMEARKIIAGRSTIQRALEKRADYLFNTQASAADAASDLAKLEQALAQRISSLLEERACE